MRRPGLHKTIGLQNEMGLSHLLTGQSRVRDVVQRTAEPNLFAITAGLCPAGEPERHHTLTAGSGFGSDSTAGDQRSGKRLARR